MHIPDPPTLPEVPPPTVACQSNAYDPKNISCPPVCPPDAPPDRPGCSHRCPTPPDVENPACWKTMPCPVPPDRRVRACDVPIDPPPRKPVVARVINKMTEDSDLIVTVGAGTDQSVGKGWRATVVRSQDGPPVPGGEAVIIRVDKHVTIVRVKLTVDQLNAAPWIRLQPP
jgi:hypothetical protein